MKILHLSNTAGKFGGGISYVVHSLIKRQKKKGLNIYFSFVGKKIQLNTISKELKINKNKISIFHKFSFFNLFKILIYATRKKNNFNIIHQHGVFLPISIISLLKSYSNTKVIISPHGLLEPDKLKISKTKKKIVLFLYEKLNLRKSSCLVACSKQEAIFLNDLKLNKPIVIIPNGLDDEFLNKKFLINEKKSFKNKMQINNESKILLFLSRVHPWKGLKLLVEVINSIKTEFNDKGWILLIAGPDELNHRNEIQDYLNKNNLNHIIKFTGPLFNDDKLLMYDCASCCILPSKGENFGVSIIEALARSKPVITTKNTPWAELIEHKCGWFVKRTNNNLKYAILEMINTNEVEIISMGKRGKELVKNKYSWSIISDQYDKLYKMVDSNCYNNTDNLNIL